eukprot:6090981-Prymnesium_polylepis.1
MSCAVVETSTSTIIGFSARSCVFPTTAQLRQSCSTLSKPSIPAAPSLCPRLAFAAPTTRLSPRSSGPCTAASARTSVGSPNAVPVPCASVVERFAGVSCARSKALVSSVRCAEPLGAVKLAARPLCRCALLHRPTVAPGCCNSTTAPQPSPLA